MLGVSQRTVWRRITKHSLNASSAYSDMCDGDLDEHLQTIQLSFPNCGQRMMDGHLRAQGIVVQRERIRESLRRTDPAGVILRQRLALVPRAYHVPHPNALWHIDGNHKLIRSVHCNTLVIAIAVLFNLNGAWSLVVHGGIDGYSRLPVYLRCSDNNRSQTLLEAFLTSVHCFGLPSRV